ncbi:MAG: HlyD family efflux transporter periplasmic adaptor subunit [Chitinophagaceae bacterium]|nr:HlyD family efflux transporter periplasmic adaptor subunit [Chitinophagaceae bacterium]MCB9045012.1 HlyD family efflux transporter periplasmic adaptor subunit [Chitinophagales bacterium]
MKEVKKIVGSITKENEIRSFSTVYRVDKVSKIRRWVAGIFVTLAIIIFLPWTQNIRARGSVTTLRQEDRPQELNSIIPGKIVKWYVKEGDFVNAGDTIVQLAEIKDEYLDPQLTQRISEQIVAKKSSIRAYNDKIAATRAQITALEKALEFKLQQLKMKVTSDSIEAVAATNALKIADEQYKRQLVMRDSGLVSKVQLEQRNQKYQDALAKATGTEIKYSNSLIELSQIRQEYAEKIMKARSEIAATESYVAVSEGELSKLNNQYTNYTIRAGQYYLKAPQDGQVVKATKAGLNEIVKDGEKLVQIVPGKVQHAVEIFVRPVDLPLLSVGTEVRFLFDGFPAIVFSGWPNTSYGTFTGEVAAIESSVSSNGKFRVLVKEEKQKKPWPPGLTIGAGASAIILLNDVPIWYELWRNINGFPPDYYRPDMDNDIKTKK